jgi:hypothetical protein
MAASLPFRVGPKVLLKARAKAPAGKGGSQGKGMRPKKRTNRWWEAGAVLLLILLSQGCGLARVLEGALTPATRPSPPPVFCVGCHGPTVTGLLAGAGSQDGRKRKGVAKQATRVSQVSLPHLLDRLSQSDLTVQLLRQHPRLHSWRREAGRSISRRIIERHPRSSSADWPATRKGRLRQCRRHKGAWRWLQHLSQRRKPWKSSG